MITRTAAPVLCLFLSAAVCQAAGLPEPKGRHVLEPFAYRSVRLENGLLRSQVDEVKQAYLGFSDDDYLIGFRKRAGLPAPGRELGGWYSIDRFIPFGQVLSGLARMYASTGDVACRDKLNRLVDGWARCIEPDGYFFYSRKPNATHYGYEKMVCGLVDAYVFAGNRDAPEHLARITRWAEKNLGRTNPYAYNGPGDPGEWYTLSENLYRAYLATGDTRYRDFAKVWEYTEFWGHIRNGTEFYGKAAKHHAYSHVNSLSGAAMAYRVGGEPEYLATLVKGYDFLHREQVYATGGYGPTEKLLPQAALLNALDDDPKADHFETQCASWAGFKLAKALISFTGDARYGDWVERLVINGTSASLPVSAKGEATYYSHYSLSGGAKDYSTGPWTCCSGTRIQAVADYHDLVYFKGDNALHVNLFTPSSCEWAVGGAPVVIRQATTFPEQGTVELTVESPKTVEFALKVRNPGWLAAPMRVRVNGTPVEAKPDSHGWIVVSRSWRRGDRVNLELPMALRAEAFPPKSRGPIAIVYGPTVLAAEGTGPNPSGAVDREHPERCVDRLLDKPLSFALKTAGDVRMRPFYTFAADEPYYITFDAARAWTRLPPAVAQYEGAWRDSPGRLRITSEPGATAEYTFNGSAIRWVGRRFDDAGVAEVFVDGKSVGTLDLYAPTRHTFVQKDVTGLAAGAHTIRIVATPQKNPRSKGHYINVARFEVLK